VPLPADKTKSDLAFTVNEEVFMTGISCSTVNNASAGDTSTVQGQAALSVMKKAMNQQAASTAQLLASLPQPALATSGGVGTQINTFA
jgi:hypothetical protein